MLTSKEYTHTSTPRAPPPRDLCCVSVRRVCAVTPQLLESLLPPAPLLSSPGPDTRVLQSDPIPRWLGLFGDEDVTERL